jgi:hypothetical protein
MSEIDPVAVQARIREVALREAELPDSVAEGVAFHMTDWLEELGAFSRFCADPSSLSDAEVSELLTNFLVHAPNHVAAAGKLYTGMPVTDVFQIGATLQDTNGRSPGAGAGR